MITRVKNTGRFLKHETSRYINDCRSGLVAGVRQYRAEKSGNLIADTYVCSKNICKNVYVNMKAHNNLLTGPICIAGALLPFGFIWAPIALCLISKLRKLLK